MLWIAFFLSFLKDHNGRPRGPRQFEDRCYNLLFFIFIRETERLDVWNVFSLAHPLSQCFLTYGMRPYFGSANWILCSQNIGQHLQWHYVQWINYIAQGPKIHSKKLKCIVIIIIMAFFALEDNFRAFKSEPQCSS